MIWKLRSSTAAAVLDGVQRFRRRPDHLEADLFADNLEASIIWKLICLLICLLMIWKLRSSTAAAVLDGGPRPGYGRQAGHRLTDASGISLIHTKILSFFL